MAAPSLVDRLKAGACLYTAWSTIPEPVIAELCARGGFDCVTVDMQHGMHDAVSVMRSISGIALAGRPALVRVMVGDNGMVSRALDLGAEAVIAPMINTVAEAKAFVAAAKYPPIGNRSWGPLRAQTIFGIDPPTQLKIANSATLAIAMIETRQALDALDDILALEGIDGIFVGPSDLSVTLTDGKRIAPGDPIVDGPMKTIAEKTMAAGKIAGAFAWGGGRAQAFKELGYRLIAIGTDQAYLAQGIKTMLTELGPEIQR
ncbi:MAG: aldolase/citrate lyase family protein [Bauldia sp.]|nr:aldolase/citrate lyase family protein [Bauldia sp.]